MFTATFCFHGDLGFFLPRTRRNHSFEHPFSWRASIKDMVESLGPPHTEIEALIVNGKSVDFDYIVEPNTHIDVHDARSAAALGIPLILRPPLAEKPRFVLDTHLGRLASYLRMLGFDTLYRNDYPDDELAYVSSVEKRILLTRDIGLLKRSMVVYGYFMRAVTPKNRVIEVMQRFQLADYVEPFRHCMKCNGLLHPVDKHSIAAAIPHNAAHHYDEFHQCANCARIYWKGSHYDRMQAFMDEVLSLE